MAIVHFLRDRARLRSGRPPLKGVTVNDVLEAFAGAKIVEFPAQTEEASGSIAVKYPENYPTSVQISEGVIITDVPKFVAKTLGELQNYVQAVNAKRQNWLAKSYLVDEKISRLLSCGVTVEITDIENFEPELKPLKGSSTDSPDPRSPELGVNERPSF